MIAMIAASAALSLTGTPFDGPVAGLRIGRVNGEFKAFLSPEEREASDLDLVVAGIESGITMVEAGADEVPEEVVADALAWAFEHYQPYQKRISAAETRTALLRLLPNLNLTAGSYYDSSDYLLNQDWVSAGAQVSWNLLNVFRIGRC